MLLYVNEWVLCDVIRKSRKFIRFVIWWGKQEPSYRYLRCTVRTERAVFTLVFIKMLSKEMELLVPLTQQEQDEIYEEVGYKRAQLDQDVKQIREWLAEQHHLPPSRLTEEDTFLKTYLVGCKGSLEKVKGKLDAYYTYRSNSELFENRDPLDEEYVDKTRAHNFCVLPNIYKSKELILIFELNDPDIKNYSCVHNVRRMYHLMELVMRTPDVVSSIHYICDLKGITAGHIATIPLTLIRDSLTIIQNVLPHRIKNMIFFNLPTILEVTVNSLIKPFLSNKLKERFHLFSGGSEELHKIFDKSILPKDYKGDLPKTSRELTGILRSL